MTTASRPITIVTGGGRGIGAATVDYLARAGHDLVIGYAADRAAAQRVLDAAEAAGARAVTVAGDVVDEQDIERLFDAAAELGQVTGLVNNAGLTAYRGDLADTPVAALRRAVDVNVMGVLLCCRRAVQAMSTARGGAGGAIVNVSSAAVTLGSPHDYVHYAASKAAVDALTMGLAKEVAAEGIRVNAVSPGVIRTDIHAATGEPDRAERLGATVPMGRPGEPDEVAPAIGWLLGPESVYVTGANIRIAGGR
ncbi:MAG: SDR family oxidoreductase [Mycobacteriales bacterium]